MKVFGIDPVDFGKRFYRQTQHDDINGLAAQLSYHFFLALFPFLMFITALAGFVASTLNVQNPVDTIVSLLGQVLPQGARDLIRPQIEYVVKNRTPGLLSIGIFGSIYASTMGTKSIMKAMNRAYDVKETRPFVRQNLAALGLTLLASAVVVGSFVLFFVGQAFARGIASSLGLGAAFDSLMRLAFWLVPLALLAGAMVYVYWAAPNVKLPLRWSLPGAIVFSIGWVIATYIFSLYVTNFASYNATYGSLGGVAILLLWFYITSLLLVAGADFNVVLQEALHPEDVDKERHAKDEEARQQKGQKGGDGRAGDSSGERERSGRAA